jgi:hypothetical protein
MTRYHWYEELRQRPAGENEKHSLDVDLGMICHQDPHLCIFVGLLLLARTAWTTLLRCWSRRAGSYRLDRLGVVGSQFVLVITIGRG